MLLEKRVTNRYSSLDTNRPALTMILIHNLRQIVVNVLLVVGVVALAACQSADFKTILTSPPCWQAICPGVTTHDEATTQLSSLKFVDVVWYDNERKETRWNFSSGTGFIIYDQEETVKSVVILFTSTNPTIEQVSDLFGTPSAAIAFVGCDDYGDISTALDITLFYPETYTVLTWRPGPYLDPRGEAREISIPEIQEISVIYYHSSSTYNEELQELVGQIDTQDALPTTIQKNRTKLYVQKACN